MRSMTRWSSAFAFTVEHSAGLVPGRPVRTVRERGVGYAAGKGNPTYESEGSYQRALGSILATYDARWTASLTVPIPERDIAIVAIDRRGVLPEGYRGGDESVHLSIPPDELDALLALLAGIVDQGREDGILPPRTAAPDDRR